MDAANAISRYLDTNGDGTGTKNAVGNYSAAATDFYISPGSAYRYNISRMIVSMEDAAGMRAERYASLAAALTNGVSVLVLDKDDNTLVDLTDGEPVTTNGEWVSLCYDGDVKSWGAGDEMLPIRWTFSKFGSALLLKENEKLVVRLNDDFTGVVKHKFMVQGEIA